MMPALNKKRRGSRSPNSEIPTALNEIAFQRPPITSSL